MATPSAASPESGWVAGWHSRRPPRRARLPPTAADYPGVGAGVAAIAARSTDEAPLVASCNVLLDTRM
jgi:hypothetical protein